MTAAPLLAVLAALAGPAWAAEPHPPADSLRPGKAAPPARHRAVSMALGAVVPGYFSSRGLPPRPGVVVITDTGLVFRSADGGTAVTYPLVGPVRGAPERRWRASAVSLAYVDRDGARPVYVFRLDGGVFATEGPEPLLEVSERPGWLDSLHSREWTPDRPLVAPRDSSAMREVTRRIAAGTYADTLYALFGRPERPVGLVGNRGRNAGRLGEYLAQRDSLALDPARMISEDQLRHALAHELGHRWQARAPSQLAVLWQGVPRIRDPKRYGHTSVTEQQAEAIAFAVHFLQATGAAPPAEALVLLAQYEAMVPGTRLIARYLALQQIYERHPLRQVLTSGESRASP